MDALTRGDLEELAQATSAPCVSLLQPTSPTAPDALGAPILFRNLLDTARRELQARGMRRPEAEQLLDPATRHLGDRGFWAHAGRGVAVFLAPGFVRDFQLAEPVQETAVIAPEFHVLPLLPQMEGAGEYYILAVSANACRLLRGNRLKVEEVDVEGMPTSLQEALGRQRERQLNLHSHQAGGQGRAGRSTAIFHGHEEAARQIDAEAYLRRVAGSLEPMLREQEPPVVFAGVEELFPIFRSVAGSLNLVAQPVLGNPESRTEDELHRLAWPLVEPLLRSRAARSSPEVFGVAREAGRATENLAQAVDAATNGLVACLFVRAGAEERGDVREQDGRRVIHRGENAADRDLLNYAAVHVLRNRGDVRVLDADEMPTAGPLAALLRAPASSVPVS